METFYKRLFKYRLRGGREKRQENNEGPEWKKKGSLRLHAWQYERNESLTLQYGLMFIIYNME
jgi:hypothetical protein